ncbi:MAG: hypothetical protein H6577_02390 [Lewinellaceae bacterium]|nr:hypothetical protein [Saprospiraceae bacterium]MCB9336957.1 hypothetical protein [Lewinellaceae bacterium]
MMIVHNILPLSICLCCWTLCFSQIGKEDRHFDGLYLGANAGSQNLFGGSFVDGVDVLAQESRFVAELFTGFRKQFLKGRMLAGAEVQIGFTDGNLTYHDPSKPLTIHYKNNFQHGFGLTLGAVFFKKKNLLVFAYAFETKRTFDVAIRDAIGSYKQTDEQGMLKYGLGTELHLWKGLNARATLGRLRVDFGDLVTNIDVEDKWDVTVGVSYQFRLRLQPQNQ